MFFDTKNFQAIQSSLDGLAIQQKVIMHNLANMETPGYKAKSVSFGNVLSDASTKFDYKAQIVTDETTTVRPDGNNVNADMESLKLSQNYIQQLYLYQKAGGQFTKFRYVLNNAAK